LTSARCLQRGGPTGEYKALDVPLRRDFEQATHLKERVRRGITLSVRGQKFRWKAGVQVGELSPPMKGKGVVNESRLSFWSGSGT
jgi:hypothetical protein